MELVNRTPFALAQSVYLDVAGAERLVVVLKGTWSVDSSGKSRIAEKQSPIGAIDEFRGDPTKTSIRQEAELSPAKPSTDVLLFGSAIAPRRDTRSMEVSLRAGGLAKRVAVFGNRVWKSTLGIARIASPEPFERIPLIWENAFGGQDSSPKNPKHRAEEPRNPIGRGFAASKSTAPWIETPLPNIEDPRALFKAVGQRVTPQGFGPLCRHWEPRRGWAGTYDQEWMERRIPLLPLDFDARFHQAAPPDLVAPSTLRGDESVEVVGCTKEGRWGFALPRVSPQARVRVEGRSEPVALALNTVAIDCDRMELRLLWKGEVGLHRKVAELRRTDCWLEGNGS